MEATSWFLPKEGIEIPNLFSDLGYPKMETASENIFGNDGVVLFQNKSSHHQAMVLYEDYFNFDISASKTYTQTCSLMNISYCPMTEETIPSEKSLILVVYKLPWMESHRNHQDADYISSIF